VTGEERWWRRRRRIRGPLQVVVVS